MYERCVAVIFQTNNELMCEEYIFINESHMEKSSSFDLDDMSKYKAESIDYDVTMSKKSFMLLAPTNLWWRTSMIS